MTHNESFTVASHEEGYLIVTTTSGEGHRMLVEPSKPLILTQNAAITQGRFMNAHGHIYKTTAGTPKEVWDDGQTLYIRVRSGHVAKYCLTTGRKLQG